MELRKKEKRKRYNRSKTIRMTEETAKKIEELSNAGYTTSEYIRDHLESCIDKEYEAKLGTKEIKG